VPIGASPLQKFKILDRGGIAFGDPFCGTRQLRITPVLVALAQAFYFHTALEMQAFHGLLKIKIPYAFGTRE